MWKTRAEVSRCISPLSHFSSSSSSTRREVCRSRQMLDSGAIVAATSSVMTTSDIHKEVPSISTRFRVHRTGESSLSRGPGCFIGSRLFGIVHCRTEIAKSTFSTLTLRLVTLGLVNSVVVDLFALSTSASSMIRSSVFFFCSGRRSCGFMNPIRGRPGQRHIGFTIDNSSGQGLICGNSTLQMNNCATPVTCQFFFQSKPTIFHALFI